MPFEHLSKLVYGVVLPEEVSLLIFDPLFESEDGRQLGARVAHLARINLFEEQRDVTDLIGFI